MPVLYSSGGASGSVELTLTPNPATNLVAKGGNAKVSLTWTDPEDRQEGLLQAKWDHSILIRKQGSAPTSVMDGTKVLESSVKNQYSTNAYVDTTVSNDIEYFYAVYTYSTEGAMSTTAPIVNVTPSKNKIMTVIIDQSNSNPDNWATYADDAIDMPSGKDANDIWQEFFGYRPCLFKDGKVVGYLNPNDYSKFENGDPADITSGNAGDVMVEFPRRGLKITTVGTTLTISMTDADDHDDFNYFAHTHGSDRVENFYIGAYHSIQSAFGDEWNNPRSISQPNPHFSSGRSPFDYLYDSATVIDRVHSSRGSHYYAIGFYQVTMIQAMYLLQFKGNPKVWETIGFGIHHNGIWNCAGALNDKGLIYGRTDIYDAVKLFGIENLWGYASGLIIGGWKEEDGSGSRFRHKFQVSTIPTINNSYYVVGYTHTFPDATSFYSGYVARVIGNDHCGFLANTDYPTIGYASASTYWCSNQSLEYDSSYSGDAIRILAMGIADIFYPTKQSLFSAETEFQSYWSCLRLMYL